MPYSLLFEELGLGEGEGKVRELEDLIIETIYMVRACVRACIIHRQGDTRPDPTTTHP